MCFSGITLWIFPSPSLQDIFQTPLEALGAEHRTFLVVLRIARLPERITLSSIAATDFYTQIFLAVLIFVSF